VMARTTLSRKSFYVYFRDRHELIARLVAPLRKELDTRLAGARTASHATVREQATAIIAEAARIYVEHGELLRALRESSGHDADAARVWREFTDPPIAALASWIRTAAAEGQSEGLDADATARALITMNLACFFDQLIGNPDAEPDRLAETLAEVWTRTIYSAPVRLPPGLGADE